MKFELCWGTGNEFCLNCGDQIKPNKPYMKLFQNRWAKPRLCKGCMKEMCDNMDRMENGELIIKKEPRKEIIEDVIKVSGNGWMQNY